MQSTSERIDRLNREMNQRFEQQQKREAAERQRSYDNWTRQLRQDQDERWASLRRQHAEFNSFRPPPRRASPAYEYAAQSALSTPAASKYKPAQKLGFFAAVLTGLAFFVVPQISVQFTQVSGAAHAATAIGTGLIVGFAMLVIVSIVIAIVAWIRNHPILFLLAAGVEGHPARAGRRRRGRIGKLTAPPSVRVIRKSEVISSCTHSRSLSSASRSLLISRICLGEYPRSSSICTILSLPSAQTICG